MDLIVNSFLTKEKCKEIIEHCETTLELEDGKLARNNDTKTRKSKVAFTKLDGLGVIKYEILKEIYNVHKIDGVNLDDDIVFQFTKYGAGDYYDWHTDSGNQPEAKRYLSVIILLNDDYDGGDLVLGSKGGDSLVPKITGNLIVFDSNRLHKVTPVISGTRYSLVTWLKLKKIDGYIKKLL